jgi:hypothetical protein
MAKDSTPKIKTDDDIIADAKKYFDLCVEKEKDQRLAEIDDIRFSGLLEQWPDKIKAIREDDPQGARPCLVVDKVNQYKNQIVNNMRMNRPAIKVRPVDDTGDEEVAEILQGIVRHIEDYSKADIAYDWAADGAVTNGLGFFRILTEYVGDTFQQEIRIARVINRFSVYMDFKEPDGSDATACLITERVKIDQFKADYPDSDIPDFAGLTGTGDVDWRDKDEVRIAEYYYIEKEPTNLFLLEDGNSVYEPEYEPEMGNVLRKRKSYRKVVKWAKLTSYEVLEKTTVPGGFIPVVPEIGIETYIDGKRYLRGIIRGVKDAQRMYNYNRSVIAESLNLTIKAPFIGYVGQFKTAGDKWAAANRNNYAYLEADPISVNGTLAPLPQRQGYAGVPAGLLQDIQTSEHDIQAALGMYNASIASEGEAKSGRAMNEQHKVGDIATFHFPDNQSRSIRQAGKIIISMIPKVYDTARIVRILGEDGSVDHAQIDPDAENSVNEAPGPYGDIKKIYNLGVGKYDVSVSSGASYATKRMEGADFLTQVVQTNPELMPVVGDLLFKSMDMPYADEIADRIKLTMPPQLQQAVNDKSTNPEVARVKQQAQQAIDQLHQQLQQYEQGIHDATTGIHERDQQIQQAEQSIEQLKGQLTHNYQQSTIELQVTEAESQAKIAQAHADEVKAQAEIMVAQAEIYKAQQEQGIDPAALEQWKTQADHDSQERIAKINADKEITIASITATPAEDETGEDQKLGMIVDMQQQTIGALQALSEALSKPKTIVRGPDGRAIGVK